MEVILVTPQNLDKYILPDYPLHPSFPYLSLVHKSDYLRCYFMHHYGGGYVDVKKVKQSWKPAFDCMHTCDSYVLGYREIGVVGVVNLPGRLGLDIKRNYELMLGNTAYICRSYTPFSHDWYAELHRRMDNFAERLMKNPGNVMGDNVGYPIRWSEILGDIFHPLCLKYHCHLAIDNSITPSFADYR